MVPVKRNGSCKHDGEVAAQRVQVLLAQVDAVDKNLAGGHVVEAHHQAGERGFARAGVAHDGYGLAGLDGEGDIFENPFDAGMAASFGGVGYFRRRRGRRRDSRSGDRRYVIERAAARCGLLLFRVSF
jgi:hypothetical protein